MDLTQNIKVSLFGSLFSLTFCFVDLICRLVDFGSIVPKVSGSEDLDISMLGLVYWVL